MNENVKWISTLDIAFVTAETVVGIVLGEIAYICAYLPDSWIYDIFDYKEACNTVKTMCHHVKSKRLAEHVVFCSDACTRVWEGHDGMTGSFVLGRSSLWEGPLLCYLAFQNIFAHNTCLNHSCWATRNKWVGSFDQIDCLCGLIKDAKF